MTEHHAIIIPGPSLSAIQEQLPILIDDIDTDVIAETVLSIATVRSLIARAQQRPVEAPVRSFIIETTQIPVLAQNALLKLFEDPPLHVRFIVVLPRPEELIATLRSRVQVEGGVMASQTNRQSPELLGKSVGEQLATVAAWVKEGEQAAIDQFLQELEYWFAGLSAGELKQFLPTYLTVVARLRQPGAAKKMLLEHLVLSLATR